MGVSFTLDGRSFSSDQGFTLRKYLGVELLSMQQPDMVYLSGSSPQVKYAGVDHDSSLEESAKYLRRLLGQDGAPERISVAEDEGVSKRQGPSDD